jgi:hypothetical protein
MLDAVVYGDPNACIVGRSTRKEVRIPKVGEAVKVVTFDYVETHALVTAVHGTGYQVGGEFRLPLINCVYVSTDPRKSDSWGRQIERDLCSLQHKDGTAGMPKPGRYYDFM